MNLNGLVIYHIYPRSFLDTTGDGIGDLEGIIKKLPYIKDLGVDAIWLSPFFCSPQKDHGYDVSDYYHVDPLFGNDTSANRLIHAVHRLGMKIIFDLVLNHTSDEHDWFKESRSSKDNPYRDFYIWKTGVGVKPPNNWKSMLGASGWNYDSNTGEWYYTSFLPFQPDLNYDHPEVKQRMFEMVDYWLKQGVDGFRLDIINSVGKDTTLRNNPFSWNYLPSPVNGQKIYFQNRIHNYNHPKAIQFSKDLRELIDTYPNRFLIGELTGTNNEIRSFLGNGTGLNSAFYFRLIHYKYRKRYFEKMIRVIKKDFEPMDTLTFTFSNHDVGRGISRVSNDLEKAKVLYLILLSLRGMSVLYYGDEIGMGNHDLRNDSSVDPIVSMYRHFPKKLVRLLGVFINRDDARTPMQWDDRQSAGFSSSRPWLPVIPNYKKRNVKEMEDDQESLLNCIRRLLHVKDDVIRYGTIEPVHHRKLLIYKRVLNDESRLIIVNLTKKPQSIGIDGDIIFQTHQVIKTNELILPSDSGVILIPHVE